ILIDNNGRSVTMADWESAQAHFSGAGRPDLVFEILANAELLAHDGNHRSALVEAVSALEVAVNDIGRKPAKSLLISEEIHHILQNYTLQNIAQRMGLTAAVTILLPIIIPKTDLPKNILMTCGNAILQ